MSASAITPSGIATLRRVTKVVSQVVPEPALMALPGVGLLGPGLAHRREPKQDSFEFETIVSEEVHSVQEVIGVKARVADWQREPFLLEIRFVLDRVRHWAART